MMTQYIKCGGLLEGQRRRDVDLVKLERESEGERERRVVVMWVQCRWSSIAFYLTLWQPHLDLREKWRDADGGTGKGPEDGSITEPAAWKCLVWVLTSGTLKEENEGAKIFAQICNKRLQAEKRARTRSRLFITFLIHIYWSLLTFVYPFHWV